MSTAGVTNPAPSDVYRSLRYGNFSYTIPGFTPSASYTVRLHFAEIVYTSSGSRAFDFAINGTNVLTNFDIIATCGNRNQALIEEFTATADGSGNISITVSAVTDNPQINGIEVLGGSSAGVTTNTYDPNGNLITATDWTGIATYTWDNENRLLSVANGLHGVETYTYDGDGGRREKVTSAQTNNFVWDGQNVLQERSVSNVRLAQYTDYPGFWGGLASGRQGSTSSFYGFDSQGSARILVNIGGTITDSYSYKAFGLELAQGTGPQAEYTTNPYRYVGQFGYYRDPISRLYVRARHLDTVDGRFLSEAMLEERLAGEYPYAYVMNNPVTYIDPEGLQFQESRPGYDPDPWNQIGIIDVNNCWSYACNWMNRDRPIGWPSGWPYKPQPGGPGCVTNACSCQNLMACVAKHHRVKPRKGKTCPPGTYTMILFVTSRLPCDYHFIRLDSNGRWSEKCGSTAVGPQFDDPYKEAREHGYDTVCQHYCVTPR